VAPEACLEIISLARSQDHLRGGELQLRLLPVARAVTTQFGIGGLKAGLEIIGLYGGPPRAPLPTTDEKVKAQIRDIFRSSGLVAGLG
jgi:4-hydroxy-2-oxoglutarate aldolase